MSEGARIGAATQVEEASALETVPRVPVPGIDGLAGLSVEHVLALQRTAGNAAVTRMIARAALAEPETETEEAAEEEPAPLAEPAAEEDVESDEGKGDGEAAADEEQPPERAEPEDRTATEPEETEDDGDGAEDDEGGAPLPGDPPQTAPPESMEPASEAGTAPADELDPRGVDTAAPRAAGADVTAPAADIDSPEAGSEAPDVDAEGQDEEEALDATAADDEVAAPSANAVVARLLRLKAPKPQRARPRAVAARADVLKVGDKGRAVKTLQRNLRVLGWYRGTIDGEFGAGTESAVKRFQSAAGLADDGVVGPATNRKLKWAAGIRREITRLMKLLGNMQGGPAVATAKRIAQLRKQLRRYVPHKSGRKRRRRRRGSGAAPGGPTAAPPKEGTQVGIVSEDNEREQAKLREKPSTRSRVIGPMRFGTKLYIIRRLGSWYEAVAPGGSRGYVAAALVKTNLPEPGARLYRIGESETGLSLANRFYGHLVKPGQDLRFYVNVLEYVNRGPGPRGVYQPNPDDHSRGAWKNVRTRANYMIWVPSDEFAQKLKGIVSSGSLTGGLWARARRAIHAIESFAVGGIAFVAGLVEGAIASVKDLLTGAAALVGGVWKVLKSAFQGDIVHDAKHLWDVITHIDVRAIAESWVANFVKRWNAKSIWDRWRFRGWVAGYAIAEALMVILTSGGTLAVKLAGKMGKLGAKLTGFARKLGDTKLGNRAARTMQSGLLARQLVRLGLRRSYVVRLNSQQRGAVARALNRWNVNRDGQSQGVVHIIEYARGGGGASKANRLERLESYHGVGPFNIKDPDVIPNVTDTVATLIRGDNVHSRKVSDKEFFFVSRNDVPENVAKHPAKGTKGTIVIKQSGKLSTFHNGEYRRYLNLK
jgi:peptidoglycan hydrolase-like protein with peptidoglycan-binding domain